MFISRFLSADYVALIGSLDNNELKKKNVN
jgi:hypothetical protein